MARKPLVLVNENGGEDGQPCGWRCDAIVLPLSPRRQPCPRWPQGQRPGSADRTPARAGHPGPGAAAGRIHRNALEVGEVEDEAGVVRAVTRSAVPATAHG